MEDEKLTPNEKQEIKNRNMTILAIISSAIVIYTTKVIVSNRLDEFEKWKSTESDRVALCMSFYVTEGAISDPDTMCVVVSSPEEMMEQQGILDRQFQQTRDYVKSQWNTIRDDLKNQIQKLESYLLQYVACTDDELCVRNQGATRPRVVMAPDFSSAVWNRGSFVNMKPGEGQAIWIAAVSKHKSDLLNLIVASDDAFKTLQIKQT